MPKFSIIIYVIYQKLCFVIFSVIIHIITSTPPNPNGLIALSADTSNFCFLAYPGHSHTGQLQVR